MVKTGLKYLPALFLFLLALGTGLVSTTAVSEELRIETVVGTEIVIEDTITYTCPDTVNTLSISGIITISNGTVFYIDSVACELQDGACMEISKNIKRNLFNTACSFDCVLEPEIHKENVRVGLKIYGEALAGNDSVCSIVLKDVEVNGTIIGDSLVVNLVNRNVGSRLPYVRFPFLSEGRPNPVSHYSTITWEYWFDQDSDVTLSIYDLCGREKILEKFTDKPKGLYTFTFTPDYRITSGFYILLLETNSGTALRSFFIME